MSYQLLYTARAERDLKQLPPDIKIRLERALIKLSSNPLYYSKRLSDTKIGTYRFRMGNYRIIFDTDRTTIIVLRIGHRRDIYRR